VSRETLEARVARLETLGDALLRDIARVERDVDAFGPLAGQIIEFVAEVKSLGDDLHELKKELREDRTARSGMSATLRVALISGSFLLAAALVAAVAQIVSGS
jgi:hypothetical protein